jgi:chromosome partitioning protein
MARLAEAKARAAFVLNRANKRTKSFDQMRTKLLKHGSVCPVEIPQAEEVHLTGGKGLGVLDLSRSNVAISFEGLWSYVEREAGL